MAKQVQQRGGRRKTLKPRQSKKPSALRALLANNVRLLLVNKYGDVAERTWAEKSGIAQGTLGRALNSGSGVTLETLEAIAMALDLAPYQLLIDIQDAKDPPIVPGATSDERKLYNQFLELRKSIASKNKH